MAINLTSPNISNTATLIADTGLFTAPLNAADNYLPIIALGTQLAPGALPISLTQVIPAGKVAPVTASAAFEINSVSGGFLGPRMTLQQRDALIATEGMQVFVTTDNGTVVNKFCFFESGSWVFLPATGPGTGNVSFIGVPPVGQFNVPFFADTTGLNLLDSGMTIENNVFSITAKANLVTGNQLTNISSVDFVTAGNNTNDVTIGISSTLLGAQIAKIFLSNSGISSIVFGNSNVGSPTSPSAVVEIQSNVLAPACLLNARLASGTITSPVNGMQLYDNNDNLMKFYQNGAWVSYVTGGPTTPIPGREVGTAPNISLYFGTGFNASAAGARNLGISDNALLNLVNGNDNISLGTNSCRFLDNSSGNVAVGSGVYGGVANISALNSVFMGSAINLATVNSVNSGVIIGTPVMASATASSINGSILIGGVGSLSSNLNNCIYIGSSSSGDANLNGNSTNRIVIGSGTACNVDNAMVIGGFKGSATAVNVGIGTQNPIAALHVNGSQALGFTRFISSPVDGVITSNYTVLGAYDYCIPVDCSAGTVTITLPANPGFGQIFIIKDVSGTAGTSGRFVNINPNGRTIDGKSPTLSMSIPYSSITIYANGTNYFSIAGSYVPLPVGILNEVTPLSYPYSVQLSDNVIFVDSSSARTINLPNATTSKGQLYFVKDATGSSETNNITVQVTGGANIDGALTATVDVNYGAIAFISNGTQYYSLSTDNVGGPLFPYREHGSGTSTSLYMGTGYNTTNTGTATIIAGYGSGALMTGANSNTVFGVDSLAANVNLPQNIVVGNNSFNALTTGLTSGRGHNICIGNNSANGLITATSVIVIGDAITVTDNIENSVVMGVGASVSVNNAIVLGNGHNIGISNSSPVYGLHNLASRGDNITNINNTNSPYTPDYTLDYNIFVDTSTGAVTVDLPTAPATGLTFVIKDVSGNSATNNITINAAAGGAIDGAGSVVINNAYGAITVVASVISPNTNYAIV